MMKDAIDDKIYCWGEGVSEKWWECGVDLVGYGRDGSVYRVDGVSGKVFQKGRGGGDGEIKIDKKVDIDLRRKVESLLKTVLEQDTIIAEKNERIQ